MSRTATAWFCAVLIGLNGAAYAAPESETEFSAKVVAVLDGDTVLVVHRAAGQRAGGLMKIRLAEIDAPEKKQAYGPASRSSLLKMVLHRQVWVHTLAVDKYGRAIAQLKLNGHSVNEEMVRRGMAWEYSHYHSDRRYIALQNEARLARRGLWAQSDPTPPWLWRKQHATNTGAPQVLAPGDYTCGSKHHCAQMRSCDEAHYYLTVCGVNTLNPKGDGIPCEKLCAAGK